LFKLVQTECLFHCQSILHLDHSLHLLDDISFQQKQYHEGSDKILLLFFTTTLTFMYPCLVILQDARLRNHLLSRRTYGSKHHTDYPIRPIEHHEEPISCGTSHNKFHKQIVIHHQKT
jgi:hypothetical protein